ncbi:MAG: hypothetical protein WA639_10165 [Candidatus Acidiferrum sp.]
MRRDFGCRALLWIAGSLVGGAAISCAQTQAPAQTGTKPDAPVAATPALSEKQKTASARKVHRFWDKENDWLFAGVGAARTLDYFSTLNMRRRGRQEIFLTNDVVGDHAGFAAIEAAATGVSIGAAYLFHRYGHHKLERWTSFVHIGLATAGSVRNYCLKTAHFAPSAGSP